MKLISIILAMSAALVFTGCFSPSQKYTQAGFLQDYHRLKENKNVNNSLIWVDPKLGDTPVKRIYVAPVLLRQQKEAKDFIDASSGNFKYLGTDLHDSLVNAFARNGYEVVSSPEKGAEQLHMAITGLTSVPEDVAIYELLPIMAIIDSSRAAIGYRSDEIYLFVETQLKDSNNKANIEAVTYVTGISMSPAAIEDITPEEVKEQADKFAEKLVEALNPLLQRTHDKGEGEE